SQCICFYLLLYKSKITK
ncbi:hypothetical protein SNEBB_004016, partial [Seison nebaliae]